MAWNGRRIGKAGAEHPVEAILIRVAQAPTMGEGVAELPRCRPVVELLAQGLSPGLALHAALRHEDVLEVQANAPAPALGVGPQVGLQRSGGVLCCRGRALARIIHEGTRWSCNRSTSQSFRGVEAILAGFLVCEFVHDPAWAYLAPERRR